VPQLYVFFLFLHKVPLELLQLIEEHTASLEQILALLCVSSEIQRRQLGRDFKKFMLMREIFAHDLKKKILNIYTDERLKIDVDIDALTH
jgi:hypothetical protein